jgi:mono/diheme cytochrome c family protein
MLRRSILGIGGLLAFGWFLASLEAESSTSAVANNKHAVVPAGQAEFLRQNCLDCHQDADAEAGLDLAALSRDLSDPAVQMRWVRVFDRVQDGEMPPPDAAQVEPAARSEFLDATGNWLRTAQQKQDAELGRVRGRRLTRRELERTLHDLLGIDIPLADQLPEETSGNQFSTVADGQSISHFQLERHLVVVDVALDEAFRRAFREDDLYNRAFSSYDVARRGDRRTREPEIIDDRAVTWSSGLIFYGRIPATTAPEDGWYHFRVQASGLKLPSTGGVWCTIRSGLCVSSAPLLGWIDAFEAFEEPRIIEFEAWIPRKHMIEIRPGDTTLRKARFEGGQVGNGEGEPQNVPGVAIDWITMEQFHQGPDNAGIRRLLFDELEVRLRDRSRDRDGDVLANNPEQDAARLLERFASRAFRRPVSSPEVAPYVDLVHSALRDGQDFASALRAGYRAILCSPRFLYLTETPGPLDDHAVAARLSYMLTGRMPDERLRGLADEGRLRDPAVIRSEVERLLDRKGTRTFVADFAAEWLDLDQIDFTEPDGKLYPGFDPIVQNSMLGETRTYLERMLRDNLPVERLIDSDDTFLNSRLARFYDIDGVTGDALRRVSLEAEHRRGGVLTQGAILKVTANGTTTSPVVRGVWVSERLLGQEIPPPPSNVPAIEPDIRGATTIRELLAKHRSQPECASCHVKIDPPGFALENYDPAGRWRDRYLQIDGSRRDRGPEVDAGYTLPDGREFDDVDEFRRLICDRPERLAANVAEKLLVFGTGAPISFADRQAVQEIVARAADEKYGLRSIVHAVVTSPVFLSK